MPRSRSDAAESHGSGVVAQRTTYDVLGRVTKEEGGTVFAGSTVTTWQTLKSKTYTPTSQLATESNGDNETTNYLYDALDRAVLVTDPISRDGHRVRPRRSDALHLARLGYHQCAHPLHLEPAGYSGGKIRYAQYAYSTNGQRASVDDAGNNRTAYEYDGFDRLVKLRFPVTTSGALAASTTDTSSTATTRPAIARPCASVTHRSSATTTTA